MSKARSLIILFALLLIIVGIYVYTQVRGEEETEIAAEERIRILEIEVEEVAKMVLKSQEETLTLTRDEDNWLVDYPYPVTLILRDVEDIMFSFTGLTAVEIVSESPEDLSVFGLDDPAVEATVTLTDGSEYTVYLGNRTPVGNMFYLMRRDDPRVFSIWGSHGNHFSYRLADIRDTALTEVNIQEVTYFKLAREGQRVIEIMQSDEALELQLQLGFARWHMIQPYNEYASVHYERFNTLLTTLPQLEIAKFIDDNPENLAQYGLDTPSIELKVQDSENTLHLLFGSDYDEQHMYFQIAGQNAVYAMERELLEGVKGTSPFELIDRFSYIVMIDYVDEIVISTADAEHSLTFVRNTVEAETEGEEDEVVTTFFIDGKEVGDEEFRDFYQVLIGLIVEAENTELIQGEPHVTTTFRFNKEGKENVTIGYVPFNEDFFAVLRGGVAEFLISRKQVYHMISELEEISRLASQ